MQSDQIKAAAGHKWLSEVAPTSRNREVAGIYDIPPELRDRTRYLELDRFRLNRLTLFAGA
jgi:hypothetical protein